MKRCVIFGGGEIEDLNYIRQQLRQEDFIICADRGYIYCRELGCSPDLVLGDFDSYSGELPSDCEILRYPVEKDDTDTMIAIKESIRRGYDEILMLGMLGGRLDHTIANIQSLVYAVKHGLRAHILEKGCRITAIRDGQSVVVPYEDGYHFSVFSHTDHARGVSIRHAKYELEGEDITNGFPIGVSNHFLPGEDAQISVQEGILVIVANQGE